MGKLSLENAFEDEIFNLPSLRENYGAALISDVPKTSTDGPKSEIQRDKLLSLLNF